MAKKTKNKDLDTTNADSKTPAIVERQMNEEANLGNEDFNKKADDIRMARNRMIASIKDVKSEDRSSMSKGRRGTKVKRNTATGQGIFGS